MTDPTKPEAHPEKHTDALARSTPDDSSTLLEMFERIKALGPSWLASLIIGAAVMFWTVVRFGGDLAIKMFPMVAEITRTTKDQKAAAQVQQEAKVADTLGKIDTRLDGIRQQQATETKAINQLGSDVHDLKGRQATTDAKVRALVQERTPKK